MEDTQGSFFTLKNGLKKLVEPKKNVNNQVNLLSICSADVNPLLVPNYSWIDHSSLFTQTAFTPAFVFML